MSVNYQYVALDLCIVLGKISGIRKAIQQPDIPHKAFQIDEFLEKAEIAIHNAHSVALDKSEEKLT